MTVKQAAAGFAAGRRQLLVVGDFLVEMGGVGAVLLGYFEQIIVLVGEFEVFFLEAMVVLGKARHIALFDLSPFGSVLR